MTILRYLLVVLLPFTTATAQAEIYVCTGKAKLTVYQNFPCQFDEIGSSPTAAPTAPLRPSAVAPPVVATALPPPTQPRNGMTKDEVRAIWGEPVSTDTYSDEEGLAERSERWSYAGSREVRFVDGRVLEIQE